MILRTILSTIIFAIVCIPAIIVSVPVVALLLRTDWSGRTTIFGNAKWGRGTGHFAYPTRTYWEEFNWLVLRNPVNNLQARTLAATVGPYEITGDSGIGDKTRGGFYAIRMGRAWEYYWIKPYRIFGWRCIRARIGWKINGNTDTLAAFVFTFNPLKPYRGV